MIGGSATGTSALLAPTSLTSGSTPRVGEWTLRLLLLAVAAGLVLMHHVVGAHQHAPGQPGVADPAAPAAHASGPAAAFDTASGATPPHGAAHKAAPELPGPADTIATLAPGSAAPAPATTLTPTSAFSAPAPMPAHPSPAFLHVHHDQTGHDMAAMLHLCMAVLAAAIALAFALYLTWRRYDLDRVRPATIPHRTRRARPPVPVPLLLAQLQILRL